MFKRAPFVSIWNLNDKFKVGKGKQFMHTLVYCILIAVGGIRWAIFDAQIREYRECRVCAVLSKALKGLPCFPTCELAGRTPRVCGSCQKSGAQGQAEGWGRRGVLARALFPGASPLPKRSRHGPAALLTRWAVLRTGPQSLESPSLLRPVASLADLPHGQEQRRVTPDRTHTCPLLPREAPSLSPKAAVCTNNPWKGSPEQKQSMLLFAIQRETRHPQRTASWHTFLQTSAVFRAWPLAVPQSSKAFTMCWNFLFALSPTATTDICPPDLQQKP